MLSFRVLGVPVQQAGTKSVPTRAGRRNITEGGKGLEQWRNDVSAAAFKARDGALPMDGPLGVSITFYMPRPKSAKKSARWAHKRPDVDKLARAILDSLTVAGVITDDARVVHLCAMKRLAEVDDPWTGAEVRVSEQVW
jgi:crossover junction endodeoxyribonuclease RusA